MEELTTDDVTPGTINYVNAIRETLERAHQFLADISTKKSWLGKTIAFFGAVGVQEQLQSLQSGLRVKMEDLSRHVNITRNAQQRANRDESITHRIDAFTADADLVPLQRIILAALQRSGGGNLGAIAALPFISLAGCLAAIEDAVEDPIAAVTPAAVAAARAARVGVAEQYTTLAAAAKADVFRLVRGAERTAAAEISKLAGLAPEPAMQFLTSQVKALPAAAAATVSASIIRCLFINS